VGVADVDAAKVVNRQRPKAPTRPTRAKQLRSRPQRSRSLAERTKLRLVKSRAKPAGVADAGAGVAEQRPRAPSQ
jgi:hypothetical protein